MPKKAPYFEKRPTDPIGYIVLATGRLPVAAKKIGAMLVSLLLDQHSISERKAEEIYMQIRQADLPEDAERAGIIAVIVRNLLSLQLSPTSTAPHQT